MAFDLTLSLLKDPYRTLGRTLDQHHKEVMEGRVLLRKMVLMKGEESARTFYDP